MPRPTLPFGRWLPWALAAIGGALVARGAVNGDRETVLAGVIGLVGVIVAFPLASLLTRHRQPDE
jgi:hypothetical protein